MKTNFQRKRGDIPPSSTLVHGPFIYLLSINLNFPLTCLIFMPLSRCGYLRTIKSDMAMVKRRHCEWNRRYWAKFGKLQNGRFKYFKT